MESSTAIIKKKWRCVVNPVAAGAPPPQYFPWTTLRNYEPKTASLHVVQDHLRSFSSLKIQQKWYLRIKMVLAHRWFLRPPEIKKLEV